ncbi:MAG: carboxymuconolactone decarboxylase family protein [Actinobacteria bacterium]|nr:carboxymuconolactone decarboxylase family protein [Actinomycetota bacterium]
MATIHLIEENEASPEVREVYDDIKRHFNLDFVPNVFKAVAHDPEYLKATWESYKQDEEYWGKEITYLVSLAVDVTNQCSYCINFDTAVLKQLGYDDAKIERLMRLIGSESFFNKYAEGLQVEPDVTPEVIEKRKAA